MELDWPFFDSRHRHSAATSPWAQANLTATHTDDVEADVRALVAKLGHAGYLGLTIADGALDVRSLAIARSTLAYHSGLADFAFAMQGLGSGAISLFGTARQRAQYLSQVASGQAIAAFAMTEPECGSDAASIATTADPRRRRLCHQWREDLHLQRPDRRRHHPVRAHRRGGGRARHFGLHPPRRHPRPRPSPSGSRRSPRTRSPASS